MPYTPPTHRSPASSASNSPDVSRRSSFHTGPRPSLPRSSSYLNKHRRTPSVTIIADETVKTSGGRTDPSASTVVGHGLSETVRQSPPPRTGDQGMPAGAIISPPDSASSGSDDELDSRQRGLDKLKDLKEAVGQIPQTRTPSPPAETQGRPETLALTFSSVESLDDMPKPARKVSHLRSRTEPNASAIKSADNSLTASDDDSDVDLRQKPQMVRKKSGELVRPALRPPSRRRPSSMPGTPVFSKAVHFDSHLEHVRHFLQVDRPLAVSAGSSPADAHESDPEFPFPNGNRSGTRSPPFEWEIVTPSFPHDNAIRNSLPVKVERVWLSPDQKTMLGSVVVSNLAFQKQVSCRFTLDYWKTTSEVAAEYSHEVRPKEGPLGHDRFNFSIKLADTANLESKTLFFCVRYFVNGQEFWDNNGSANFQVDFKKKHLPQNGKNNFTGASAKPANGLPRSNHRKPSTAMGPRPQSMPMLSSDGFGTESTHFDFGQSLDEYVGDGEPTGLRLKTKSSKNLASDNIANGLSSPSGAAFANRYDFGASLTAAVQAAKDSMTKDKDGLYMKSNVRAAPLSSFGPPMDGSPILGGSPAGPGSSSPIPSALPSSSYEELVNKYCFFGSTPKQPGQGAEEQPMRGGRFDGTGGDDKKSVTASNHALQQVVQLQGAPGPFIPIYDPNPYFVAARMSSSASSPLPEFTYSPRMNETSTSKSTPTNMGSPAQTYISFAPPSSHDNSFHAQQQMMSDRFPWSGESQTATPTAIRG